MARNSSKKNDGNGIPKKLLKNLPHGFLEEVQSMGVSVLKETVVQTSGAIAETEIAKAQDEKLTAAKEKVKDLSEGYNEVLKAQKAKRNLALHFLESQGQLQGADIGE
jgi:hypothetical protein